MRINGFKMQVSYALRTTRECVAAGSRRSAVGLGNAVRLPVTRSGATFKGTGDVRGDPAAIEVSRLRLDTLVVHEAGIDAAGIESKTIAQSIVRMVR
jgi:hypothetical protein